MFEYRKMMGNEEIRDTRYEIRDMRYEIRDTRYEIRDSSVAHSGKPDTGVNLH